MNALQKLLAAISIAAIPAACISAPDAPSRPDFDIANESFATSDADIFARTSVNADWWTRFNDPVMTTLIEAALAENRDLRVAAANIETARAILNRQMLDQSFSTSGTANVELGRAARDGADIEVSGAGASAATWEFDTFGRLSSAVSSRQIRVEQLEDVRRDVAVTVASETALAYLDYRGGQVRLSVARSNADLQGDSVDLVRLLFENGRATRLDLERAEAQYRTTLASLPSLENNIRTAAIRLGVLTGRSDPGQNQWLEDGTPGDPAIPSPPSSLNVGTPEELIRRRPDIRAAEAEIARSLALGDVERARLFPTLTFSADILSLFTEDNASAESFGFGIGPAIRWDGPDLRRVRADIEIADSETRAAFAAYERTVVEALGEVEIALVSYSNERARLNDLEAAASAAEQALVLAQLRFDEGLDDFLDVIDAQRTRLDAQDRLEINRLATTRQAISTYRALGGIWQNELAAQPVLESE